MRKILFIDHSYHTKTGSAQFLIDLLEPRYCIEVLREGWWRKYTGPSRINRANYDAIIFWQMTPFAIAPFLDCANIVFFPMFDSYYKSDISAIGALPQLSVVSFCRALHDQLSGLANDRMYVKYYPRPQTTSGEELGGRGLFFWQRTTDITWDTVRRLVGECRDFGGIHLHRAVDPGIPWLAPTAEEERKYAITYSDWFETKEDYQAQVARSALYVAPRRKEGIGMSFLEALAMGKAVLAHDGPTMNEYIVHGENGYLFDCDHPSLVDLSDLRRIRQNALDSAEDGWRAWERDKQQIIDFIELRMKPQVVPTAARRRTIRRLNTQYVMLRLSKLPRRLIGTFARRLLPNGLYKTLRGRKHERKDRLTSLM